MKLVTRALFLAIAVATAASLAAPAGASVARKPNACKVVKASEVTTVTGFPAAKDTTQQQGPPDAGICGYTLTDPGTVRNVSIYVQPGSTSVAKVGFKTARKAFKDQLEPVTGFGKHAFYAAGGLNALYVRKGDTLLYVQYVAMGSDDPATIKANVESMTEIALPRI
jgi:hypothetical protein